MLQLDLNREANAEMIVQSANNMHSPGHLELLTQKFTKQKLKTVFFVMLAFFVTF